MSKAEKEIHVSRDQSKVREKNLVVDEVECHDYLHEPAYNYGLFDLYKPLFEA